VINPEQWESFALARDQSAAKQNVFIDAIENKAQTNKDKTP